MNISTSSSDGAELELSRTVRQLYTSLAPQYNFSERDVASAQELLQVFNSRNSDKMIQRGLETTAEKIKQTESDQTYNTFIQLLSKLDTQLGPTMKNKCVFVLSQLNNLGRKAKAQRPSPLSTVRSISSSSSDMQSTFSRSVTDTHPLVYQSRQYPSSISSTVRHFSGQSVPRSLSLYFIHFLLILFTYLY